MHKEASKEYEYEYEWDPVAGRWHTHCGQGQTS